MSAAHTLGPWELDLSLTGWIIHSRHGRDVVASADHDQPLSDREIADARLMVAAPSLLDSLGAVIGYAESRAEDMTENVEEAIERGCGAGEIQEAAALRDKAWKAVEDAKALLRSLR